MLVLVAGAGRGVRVLGHLEDGSIVKDHVNRRPGARVATLTGAALALIGLAAGVLLFPRHPGTTPRAAYCREGRLFGQGSSAFEDLMKTLGDQYERDCPGASVDYHETSSALGTSSLAGIDPAQAPNQLAMSDGQATTTADPFPLRERRVAVVIFAVVVSKDVGARVKTLTPDQLKHIFTGDYTNWNRIVRDFDQPIHVVSRSSTSGSRRTFEQHIIHGTEQQLNSDDCDSRRPGADDAVIRCEEGDTNTLLNKIEQTKGAIGYAELAAASRKLYVATVEINETTPNAANVLGNLYDFWTVEHAYTYGPPEPGSLVAGFLDFLSSQSATTVLESDQHLACTAREVSQLCREER
jgi:ABC-type phosphate transport system substrate-binding protein